MDSCQYDDDDECDEPSSWNLCAVGTDTSDCAVFSVNTTMPDSCAYANNNVCDEPNMCFPGTDTSDCPVSQDSCKWANDGTCDEPNKCYVGTDTTDCRVLHTNLGYCNGGDDELNSVTLNNGDDWDWRTCWSACLAKHPNTLVAIDGPGYDTPQCYCQVSCESKLACGTATSMTSKATRPVNMSSVPCYDTVLTIQPNLGYCHGADLEPDWDKYDWTYATCWDACLNIFPKNLVAIDGPVNGACYCQDACTTKSCGASTSMTSINMSAVPCT